MSNDEKYAVVIIDDEPWITRSIQKFINSLNDQFVVTGISHDAVNGLRIIEKLKPDIVFIDIRMPEISGLEMIKISKERGFNCEYVIISGFSEFEYAKEAIRVEAREFLLKPIDNEIILETLKKLTVVLENKKKIAQYKNSELIDHILCKANTANEFLNCFSLLGCGNEMKYIRIAYMECNSCSIGGIDIKKSDFFVKTIHISNEKYFLYMNYNNWEQVNQYLIAKFIECNLHLGVSTEFAGINIHMRNAFTEAKTAFFDSFVDTNNTLHFYETPLHNKSKEIMNEILALATTDKSGIMNLFLDRLQDYMIKSHLGISELCFIYNQVISGLLSIHSNAANGIAGFYTPEGIVGEFHGFGEFIEYFKQKIESICNKLSVDHLYLDNMLLDDIIRHIHEHYSSKLLLKDISEELHINPNYLSIEFKKYTDKTFTQYLTDIRIKKACELILYSRLSLKEISEKVGYYDYFNFIKSFKKHTGTAPGRYKKSSHYRITPSTSSKLPQK